MTVDAVEHIVLSSCYLNFPTVMNYIFNYEPKEMLFAFKLLYDLKQKKKLRQYLVSTLYLQIYMYTHYAPTHTERATQTHTHTPLVHTCRRRRKKGREEEEGRSGERGRDEKEKVISKMLLLTVLL